MKKKILSLLLVMVLAMTGAAACGNGSGDSEEQGGIKIVATIFPLYDWAKNIAGDNPSTITMLLDSGVDLHNYQPTTEDIRTIADCDVFLYVGGESDEWVEDALAEATNEDMVVINMMEVIGDRAQEEEVIEGMEAEDHDHDEAHEEGEAEDHDDAEEHHDEEGPELDEHLWLSLKNAGVCCRAIADALIQVDGANEESYRQNLAAYQEQLTALDAQYADAVAKAPGKTLLFGDRFPFRYLVEDYDLDYYAAFVGCSAETEASFETITFLAGKVDELKLKNICVLESSDQKIAETIRANTATKNQEILVFDSLQSTTAEDVEGGADYIAVMKQNLQTLMQALQ